MSCISLVEPYRASIMYVGTATKTILVLYIVSPWIVG